MVRFNDKKNITTLASNDIMPITDISEPLDDKKVTVNQLSKYTVDNISTLSSGKMLTDNNLTNALKNNYDEAYNDVAEGIATYSATKTYNKTAIVKLADEDGKPVLYYSLQDNNINHNPTEEDSEYWAELKTGGGGGLELATVVCMPFGIDESENKYRYLNGQTIIQSQYPAFTTKVKSWTSTRPNLFTTETNWQAEKTASKLGQCGKFVIDDAAGTIRLPLVININGLTDLANCGVVKNESLPNITGSLGDWGNAYMGTTQSGAFTLNVSVSGGYGWSTGGGKANSANFNASRSSSTYQNNAPVQQEAIQYPYVIVVNTGVEEAERPINNYQVNNVYSYGMSQYYKGTMNNNSWLRSAGQWNSGATYNGIYNWLLGKLDERVYDPSKFTVVGSPTITSDGIASNFSATSYLSLDPSILDTTKSWSITIRYHSPKQAITPERIIGFAYLDTNLVVAPTINGISFRWGGSNVKAVNFSNVYKQDTDYDIKLGWDKVNYFMTINGVEQTTPSTETLTKTNFTLGFDTETRDVEYVKGSIDLKQFSVTVDGEEVFSGSKIVQAEGFKKHTDTDITDYDFVVNTEDQTFRLPLLDGSESIPSSNRYAYNLPTANGQQYTAKYNGIIFAKARTTAANQYTQLNNYTTGQIGEEKSPIAGSINVCSIQVKAGDIFHTYGDNVSTIDTLINIKYQGDGNLYYYIGDVLQNSDLINIARLGEELVDIKSTPYIEETYVNGESWYRVYSDGWCEQGGSVAVTNETSNSRVTFIKSYTSVPSVTTTIKSNTAYSSNTGSANFNSINTRAGGINRLTTTGFYFNYLNKPASSGSGHGQWVARGYIN